MSYVYPIGVASGYSGAASYMASLMAGVTGVPFPPPSPTGNDGYLQAMCDAVMGVVGFQGSLFSSPSPTSTTSQTYVDIAGTSMVFVPPASKVYDVECDFQWYRSAGTGNAFFRIAIGSSASDEWQIVPHSTGTNQGPYRISFPLLLASGVPVTIKLQWHVTDGATTINLSGANPVHFTIRG